MALISRDQTGKALRVLRNNHTQIEIGTTFVNIS